MSTIQAERTLHRRARRADLRQCACCGILIFRDAADAEAAGIPFQLTINRAVGERCFGCATHELQLPYLEEQTVTARLGLANGAIRSRHRRKEKTMSKQDEPIFLKFEEAVDPPPPRGGGPLSKYQPIYDKILAMPVCENGAEESWHRFLLPNKKRADLVKIAVYRLKEKQLRPGGSDVVLRLVPAEGETVWLYLMRVPCVRPEEK